MGRSNRVDATLMRGLWALLVLCTLPVAGLAIVQEQAATSAGATQAEDERVDDALLLYKKGKTEAAIYLLQQVLEDNPGNTTVLFKLGEIAIGAKNWAYAIQVLRKAADLRPDDVELRLVLMDVYKAYQMPIQEIMAGREIVALDPRHAAALARLAFLYEDQAMPEEEEEFRRQLAEVSPDNYANLKRLASLLETNGDLWEAALIYEQITKRFPDKLEDARTLARLFHEDGNRYSAIRQWQRVREMPDGDSDEAQDALAEVYGAHKRELKLYDPLRLPVMAQRSKGPIDRIDYLDVDLGYNRLFLLANREIGFSAHYRRQEYMPTAFITGDRSIDSQGFLFYWKEGLNSKRTILRTSVGYEYVINVTGNTVATSPEFEDVQSFPFLERRSFGGIRPVGELEVEHQVTPRLRFTGGVRHQFVQDIDAYVRLIRRTGPEVALSYYHPSGTFLEGRYEYDWLTDDNKRSYASFDASYPIFMSASIRNRHGMRDGYLFPIPDHQLRLGYRFEFIDHSQQSSFYEVYQNERRHTFTLSTQHSLGGKVYFTAEGFYAMGEILKRQVGYRGGLAYEDPLTRTRISLTYFDITEDVLEGSQLNPALTGRSRSQGFMFQLLWQLGKGATEKEPGAPPRHK